MGRPGSGLWQSNISSLLAPWWRGGLVSRESGVCNFLPVTGKTIFSRSLSGQRTVVASIFAIIVYAPTIVWAQTSNVRWDLGSANNGDRSRVENKSARAIREHSTRAEAWVRLGTLRI